MGGPIEVVSWNLNSLRVRLPQVLRYLDARSPDVLCMQETRVADDAFPRAAFEERGYHVASASSGGYAGVAIASRSPIEAQVVGLEGFSDDRLAGRRLACFTGGRWIDTVYVPTRIAIGKIDFLDALRADRAERFAANDEVILAGDFNLCYDRRDLASATMLSDPELHPRRPEDLAFRRLVAGGLVDCFRALVDEPGHFSWFPLTSWALRRNWGMRLDYIFASPALAERTEKVVHDSEPRAWPRPSDHLPVIARFGG